MVYDLTLHALCFRRATDWLVIGGTPGLMEAGEAPPSDNPEPADQGADELPPAELQQPAERRTRSRRRRRGEDPE